MDEQELRIIATLDDRASAGIVNLNTNIKSMTIGPQAQAMEGMKQKTSAVGEGLKQLSTGFGQVGTAITGFAGMAALVPMALAGMAASFATSGIGAYADKMNEMGRQARMTGQELAQFKTDVSTLKSAGISDQEAQAVIKRFTDVQEDLAQRGSKIRQGILAATPIEGRDEMQAWLNNVMVQPAGTAMEMVRQRGESIRQGATEQARAQAAAMGLGIQEQHAYAEREGAKAQQRFLSMFGAEALAHVRKPFRDATAEEIALQNQRLVATQQWQDATSDLSSAWGDFKDTVAAIALPALLPVIQGMAAAMRGVADAARQVEGFLNFFKQRPATDATEELEKMNEQITLFDQKMGLVIQRSDFQNSPFMRGLREARDSFYLLREETEFDFQNSQFMQGVREVGDSFKRLRDETEIDFQNSAFMQGVRHLGEQFRTLRDETEIDFENSAFMRGMRALGGYLNTRTSALSEHLSDIGTNIGAMWTNAQDSFNDWLDDAKDSLATWWGDVKQSMSDMIPDSVKDFFASPSEAILTLIERIKTALGSLIPQGLKDFFDKWGGWITGRGRTAELQEQLEDYVAQAEGGEETESQADTGTTPKQRSKFNPLRYAIGKEKQGGGPVESGQPYLVGEQGPEMMVPQGGGGGILPANLLQSMINMIPKAVTTAAWGAEKAFPQLKGAYVASKIGKALTGERPTSMRELRDTFLGMTHPSAVTARGASSLLGNETVTGFLKNYLPEGLVNEASAFATADVQGPQPRGLFSPREGGLDFASLGAMLMDRSAAQQVNVSGTGRISVDVRAPQGTTVNAEGDGLFKTTEIARQTQMLPAEYGPVAGTAINPGTA